MEDVAIAGSWGGIALVLGAFALVAVIVWQVFATRRASSAITREQSYRRLAEEAAEAREDNTKALADVRAHLTSIENVLRTVQ